ncbi:MULTISPECIES: DNA cytosine methyltransferase [unclassified Pseudovibrio]|uniref:DNA cytosine methyltransferase n=1 Tax=unclassified Pseudovibrio TaxID=2627060 RepID=UPI0007AE4863|nr:MULTISPECIES: DNA cytosine methyltransferase [unclassified Pseudovibrio]KZK96632.1 Modification methylase HhaI [Pseudovibrio sp. W74]KZL03211.1 Modification methylase HhaI [Pseudovibrio sp. Ad14]
MPTIVNTKVSLNKGRKRVWIEGEKLRREGIEAGQYYDLAVEGEQLVLTINDFGARKVSRRKKGSIINPVIDLTSSEVAELFSDAQMIRVLIKDQQITICAHHKDMRIEERVSRLMHKLNNKMPLDVCSLFHGGGVLDAAIHDGLEQTGLKSRLSVAVEIEPDYLASSIRNNIFWDSKSIAIEGPIEAVNLGKSPAPASILIAGLPCTGASKSGRVKNKLQYAESHDSAGAMFFHFLQFVQAVNPAIILIENVPEYSSTASMTVIRSVLGSLGYKLSERVFEGNEFGALEARKRLCVVAMTEGLELLDLDSVEPLIKKPVTLNEILEPISSDSERWKDLDYLAKKEARDMAAGKGFKRQLLNASAEACGTIGRGYAKYRSTEPFLKHPTNEKLSRLFTPLEHARVKGIPAKLIEGLSSTTAHEVLGQSVIFPVFQAIAAFLGKTLLHLFKTPHEQLPLAA